MKIVLNLDLACHPDEQDKTQVARQLDFLHNPHWCYLDDADLLIIHAHCPMNISEKEKVELTNSFLPMLKDAPQQEWEPWEVELGIFHLNQAIKAKIQTRG